MNFGLRPIYRPKNIFIISDIHAEGRRLRVLVKKIEAELGPDDHIVFAGDLCDKGQNFLEVLKVITELKRKYPGRVFIVRGNHEQMLESYLSGKAMGMWLCYGKETLRELAEAWGLEFKLNLDLSQMHVPPEELKAAFIKHGYYHYIEDLIPYYETDKVIVTHAPLDRRLVAIYSEGGKQCEGLLDRMKREIMWEFVDDESQHIPWITKFHVCGHQYFGRIWPRVMKYRAFLDIGCGSKKGRPAVALHWPSKRILDSKGDPVFNDDGNT